MNEWIQLLNNLKKLFRTLRNCVIVEIRTRRISELERKIKNLETKLVVERKIYNDYLLKSREIFKKIRKECE